MRAESGRRPTRSTRGAMEAVADEAAEREKKRAIQRMVEAGMARIASRGWRAKVKLQEEERAREASARALALAETSEAAHEVPSSSSLSR